MAFSAGVVGAAHPHRRAAHGTGSAGLGHDAQPPPRPRPPGPGRRPSRAFPGPPGRRLRRRHPRPRRSRRGDPRGLPAGPAGRHRPRPRRPGAGGGAARARTPTAPRSCTRCTTRSPTSSPSSAFPTSDGIFFDLGVSSMQLDVRERGFAYAQDAPLDMRMNGREGTTAADVLNTYPAADLARILRDYGEEKFAKRIADRIVAERDKEPFTTLGPPRRAAVRRHPGAGAPYRRTPGQAHLPGAAHRGQRRAERPPPGRPRRDRGDQRRRPRGRGVLPLARGPAGQAGVHRRDEVRRPRGHAVHPRGPRADLPPGHPRLGEGRRARAHRQPPCRLRAAAGDRTHQRGPGPHEHPASPQQGPRPADRRGRRRAGPADRRTAGAGAPAPGSRSSPWCRCCCSAASSGC